MAWNTRLLTPSFGAVLSGARIDNDLPQVDRMAVYEAVVRHGVVVVPAQTLSDDDIFAFAESIGLVTPSPVVGNVPRSRVLPVGNVDADGNMWDADSWNVRQNRANEMWHIDLTFMRPRATISLLYGRTVPPSGGNTEFCDLRLAWEALPPEEQVELEHLTASHSLIHSRRLCGLDDFSEEDRRRFAPVERPLVEAHQENGRKALLLASHIDAVSGRDDAESLALVQSLIERAAISENCYSHRWSEGDLLLWDNRSVMHRARPFDLAQPRDMRALRLCDPAEA